VFARREKHPVLVFLDEAQNFFASASERENLTDLLTMSRSFGTFVCFLTQNASTAVRDERVLRILSTNVSWTFSMRSEPSDCAFLKPALPAFGRRPKPAVSPFEETSFFTLEQERNLALEEMTHLPAREGWMWLKNRNAQAFRMKTACHNCGASISLVGYGSAAAALPIAGTSCGPAQSAIAHRPWCAAISAA
jgi:hypothetical protein